MGSGDTPGDRMAGEESMRELTHIRLRAVEGFLVDNLGQLRLRHVKWPTLLSHD
jgi:hypothetical protein